MSWFSKAILRPVGEVLEVFKSPPVAGAALLGPIGLVAGGAYQMSKNDKNNKAAEGATQAAAAANKKIMDELAAMQKKISEDSAYAARQQELRSQQSMKDAANAQAQWAAKAASENQSLATVNQEKNKIAQAVNAIPAVAAASTPAESAQQAKIAALGSGSGASTLSAFAAKKDDAKPAPTLNAFTMPSTKNIQFGGS